MRAHRRRRRAAAAQPQRRRAAPPIAAHFPPIPLLAPRSRRRRRRAAAAQPRRARALPRSAARCAPSLLLRARRRRGPAAAAPPRRGPRLPPNAARSGPALSRGRRRRAPAARRRCLRGPCVRQCAAAASLHDRWRLLPRWRRSLRSAASQPQRRRRAKPLRAAASLLFYRAPPGVGPGHAGIGHERPLYETIGAAMLCITVYEWLKEARCGACCVHVCVPGGSRACEYDIVVPVYVLCHRFYMESAAWWAARRHSFSQIKPRSALRSAACAVPRLRRRASPTGNTRETRECGMRHHSLSAQELSAPLPSRRRQQEERDTPQRGPVRVRLGRPRKRARRRASRGVRARSGAASPKKLAVLPRRRIYSPLTASSDSHICFDLIAAAGAA